MCGRYNLRSSGQDLIEVFAAVPAEGLDLSSIVPRYNIAPTQSVLAVRQHEAERVLLELHWGLIPFWAKDSKIGNRLINARGETASSKPSFRAAFKRRRCLVLADGFYEWKKTGGRKKQPYCITLTQTPFAFAGLWERWKSPDGELIESCTIMTTEPNELMADLHDRMPVILDPSDYDLWLDPTVEDKEPLESLMRPYPQEQMTAYPVGLIVNSPRNERPECIEQVVIPED